MSDVSVKLRAETSQFRTQIKQATASVKALSAELKLNEAQYKASGDSEEYLRTKARLLVEQITEQNKIVESARSAMQKFEAAGDTTSSAYLGLRTTVANASAALTDMRSQLAEVAKDSGGVDQLAEKLDNASGSAGTLADKIGAANKAKLNTVKGEAENLKNATDGAGTALGDAETAAEDLDKSTLDNVSGEAGELKTAIDGTDSAASDAKSALNDLDKEKLSGVQSEAEDLSKAETEASTTADVLKAALGGLDATPTATEAKEDLTGNGGLTDEMGETGAEADNLEDKLKGIGQEISIEGISSSITKIKDALSSAISKAAQMGKALLSAQVDAGQWADNVLTEGVKFFDPEDDPFYAETYQRMEYASQFVDTEVETLLTARKKINDAIKSNKDSVSGVLTVFDGVGGDVDLYDSEGQLRDTMDVFWDCIDVLESMENETEKEAAANELFGRSYEDMLPLIRAGRAEYEKYMQEAPVVGQAEVEALGAQDDAVNELTSTWNTFKTEMQSELAPVLTSVSETLTGLLNSLLEWVNSEEGQATLDGLAESIEGLFASFGEDMTVDKVIDTVTGAINKLTGALAWFGEHEGLETTIKTILGVFATLEVASGITTIIQLCNSIATLAGLSSAKIAANVAAAGGSGAAASAGASAASSAGAGAAAGAATKSTVVKSAAKVLPYAAFAAAVWDVTANGDEYFDKAMDKLEENGLGEHQPEALKEAEKSYASWSSSLVNKLLGWLPGFGYDEVKTKEEDKTIQTAAQSAAETAIEYVTAGGTASEWTDEAQAYARQFWYMFNTDNGDWSVPYEKLQELLTPEAFDAFDEYTSQLYENNDTNLNLSAFLSESSEAGVALGESAVEGVRSLADSAYSAGAVLAASLIGGAASASGGSGASYSRTWANNYGAVTINTTASAAETFRDWQIRRITGRGE